jgi:hypothetical protein
MRRGNEMCCVLKLFDIVRTKQCSASRAGGFSVPARGIVCSTSRSAFWPNKANGGTCNKFQARQFSCADRQSELERHLSRHQRVYARLRRVLPGEVLLVASAVLSRRVWLRDAIVFCPASRQPSFPAPRRPRRCPGRRGRSSSPCRRPGWSRRTSASARRSAWRRRR